ncbi:MAG TPA: secretin N-terminal domain-containing protein [Candidatus Sulfopaludibacter sp.]|nr:secretin N-terminal domain-containing protein [Candidatus Sulfopaludibacter sp.]
MKTIILFLLMAVLAAGTYRMNAQQGGIAPPVASATMVAGTNAPPTGVPERAPTVSSSAFSNLAPRVTDTNQLWLNFRSVPLDMVLNYLSKAAGFIIVMDTQVSGHVDVWSDRPVTRDEAVNLLNAVLNKNGYAAVRNGQTLTIMTKEDAKTRDIPVKIGNDPNLVPDNDEMVTQIIPVRYVQAKQLAADLSPFVSPQATIVANEAGNSMVITDTQSNIRHLMEIIEAVDNSAQGETEIRVFPLKYANPTDVASELGQIFPSNTSGSSQSQAPIRFGGGGGPGGFFARMMAAQNANNNQSAAMQKQSQVIAVADARTQSVIVTASKDLMDQIAGMMEQLDVPSPRDQNVYVFHMNTGDPQQAVQVLQGMFQSNGGSSASSTGSSSQNSALQNRAIQNNNSQGSTSSSSTTSGFGGSNGRGIGSTGTPQF